MSRILRSALLTAALAVAATGVSITAAGTAQAAPTCFPAFGIYQYGNAVYGTGEVVCYDPTQGWPIGVELWRQDPATGAWAMLTAGTGEVAHTCVGTAATTYKAGSPYYPGRWRTLTANCG